MAVLQQRWSAKGRLRPLQSCGPGFRRGGSLHRGGELWVLPGQNCSVMLPGQNCTVNIPAKTRVEVVSVGPRADCSSCRVPASLGESAFLEESRLGQAVGKGWRFLPDLAHRGLASTRDWPQVLAQEWSWKLKAESPVSPFPRPARPRTGVCGGGEACRPELSWRLS